MSSDLRQGAQGAPPSDGAFPISRIVFGAMALGAASGDSARRIETIRAAVAAGATSIDTAPLYEFGRSEELVGQAIQGMRGEVQLFTKVGLRWDDAHGEVLFSFRDEHGQERAVRRDSRPESVRLDVERSLRRLRVDTLDLVQVHHRDPQVPIAETMDALAQLQRAGLVRGIGVCNYGASEVAEAKRALGDLPLRSHQLHYSLLQRDAERELLPQALRERIAVLAYSPLEQGLLAGRGVESLAAGDGRRESARFQRKNLRPVLRAIETAVAPVAERRGVRVAQVALAWLLAQPGLSAVIVGASSPEQAVENAAAGRVVLEAAEVSAIRQAFEAARFDPNAGQSAMQRVARRARRVAGRVGRLLSGR